MINRRQVLAAGALLGRVALPADAAGEPAAIGQLSDRTAAEIVQALEKIRAAIAGPRDLAPVIATLRGRQTEFLRAQGKFPDAIDVSADIWFAVYDWHVQNLQPITLGRDAAGHYTLTLLLTAIVLRPEAAPNFIGIPYDIR